MASGVWSQRSHGAIFSTRERENVRRGPATSHGTTFRTSLKTWPGVFTLSRARSRATGSDSFAVSQSARCKYFYTLQKTDKESEHNNHNNKRTYTLVNTPAYCQSRAGRPREESNQGCSFCSGIVLTALTAVNARTSTLGLVCVYLCFWSWRVPLCCVLGLLTPVSPHPPFLPHPLVLLYFKHSSHFCR